MDGLKKKYRQPSVFADFLSAYPWSRTAYQTSIFVVFKSVIFRKINDGVKLPFSWIQCWLAIRG